MPIVSSPLSGRPIAAGLSVNAAIGPRGTTVDTIGPDDDPCCPQCGTDAWDAWDDAEHVGPALYNRVRLMQWWRCRVCGWTTRREEER